MPLVRGRTKVHFNGKYLGTMHDDISNELKIQVVQEQAKMVLALAKPGQKLVEEMTPLKAHLNHMCMGMCGEVGEAIDCVKKFTIYNKEIDFVNLKEELGDLLFYIFGILNATDITIYDCMESNQWKLAERYKNKTYSDQAAIERADKQGE
jgi:NTP pyrophosphatase (non-canonical NTP hydrolase)